MIWRWLPGLALIALALGSAWLLHRIAGERTPGDGQPRHEPDLFMNDFVTIRMNEQGRPAREMRGRRMVHYPDTDTHDVVAPHILIHRPDRPALELQAEHGWLSAERDVVLLRGRVEIWEDEETGVRRLEVLTRDLRLLLDEQYAETDEPATIRWPAGESRSVGLRAYMDDDRLELLSRVRTIYDPRKRR